MIQKIIDEIEQNLVQPLTVKEVAGKSGMSIWEFQRIFRAVVGDSIGGYIRSRRLTLAAGWLKETDRKIIDIALELQFGSQEAFSRAFKSHFLITPLQAKKNKAALSIQKKPRVTFEMLSHFSQGIALVPKIKELPEMRIVALETTIPSALSDYQDYDQILVLIWKTLFSRKKEIKHLIKGRAFGIARSDSEKTICGLH